MQTKRKIVHIPRDVLEQFAYKKVNVCTLVKTLKNAKERAGLFHGIPVMGLATPDRNPYIAVYNRDGTISTTSIDEIPRLVESGTVVVVPVRPREALMLMQEGHLIVAVGATSQPYWRIGRPRVEDILGMAKKLYALIP